MIYKISISIISIFGMIAFVVLGSYCDEGFKSELIIILGFWSIVSTTCVAWLYGEEFWWDD